MKISSEFAGAGGAAAYVAHYGRGVETDRSCTARHVFTGVRKEWLDRSDAANIMLSPNRNIVPKNQARSQPSRSFPKANGAGSNQ